VSLTLGDGPFNKDDQIKPFSNGEEYRWWISRNCSGCRNYRPNASSSRDGCPIEVSMAMASCIEGLVPAKHLLRAGILEPGENGQLVEALGDCSTWDCPERRGYDEPDDRLRRGPRPPEGQLDIFDPRNTDPAPTRERVHA
jgi:hypothetical protein